MKYCLVFIFFLIIILIVIIYQNEFTNLEQFSLENMDILNLPDINDSSNGTIKENENKNEMLDIVKSSNPNLLSVSSNDASAVFKTNLVDKKKPIEDRQIPIQIDNHNDNDNDNDNDSNNIVPLNSNDNLETDLSSTLNTSKLKSSKFKRVKREKSIKCKFFPSYSEGYVCPEKYPSHLGATISAKANSGLLCNGKKVKTDRAKAYAIVKNGSIKQVKLIHSGSGYVDQPRIRVKGEGKYSKLKAKVSSSGSIKGIEIVNAGKGYLNTPEIIIEEPNGNIFCHLCCNMN